MTAMAVILRYLVVKKACTEIIRQLETVSIAESCKTGSMCKTPNAVNSREKGKEVGKVRYGRR